MSHEDILQVKLSQPQMSVPFHNSLFPPPLPESTRPNLHSWYYKWLWMINYSFLINVIVGQLKFTWTWKSQFKVRIFWYRLIRPWPTNSTLPKIMVSVLRTGKKTQPHMQLTGCPYATTNLRHLTVIQDMLKHCFKKNRQHLSFAVQSYVKVI